MVIGAQVLRGSANLNSEGGREPYLQVEVKIQRNALKRNTAIWLCVHFFHYPTCSASVDNKSNPSLCRWRCWNPGGHAEFSLGGKVSDLIGSETSFPRQSKGVWGDSGGNIGATSCGLPASPFSSQKFISGVDSLILQLSKHVMWPKLSEESNTVTGFY